MPLFLLSLAAMAEDVLPVHRIRFYETGVAWFERSGPVTDETTLLVPTSHLDDALKSLVVMGGDVEVGAITFPSSISDEAAMAEAGLGEVGTAGFGQVLTTLLGGRVEAERSAASPIRGLLLDIEALAVPEGAVGPAPYALTLLTDDGAVMRLSTDTLGAIRAADRAQSGRLSRAAKTLGPTRAMRPAAIDLQMWRGGSVSLGYVAEAAVWQVTYRLFAADAARAKLQAWALVHNDTEEDWRRVQIELANGEPDSFIHPLVAPRYAERELRVLDNLSTVSQLVSATPDQLASSGATGVGYGGGGYGSFSSHGSGSGAVGYSQKTALADLKQAEPVETPTQFVYRVSHPVDLPARHSALVPLVHQDIVVERLVAFLPQSLEARTGLWLKNTTDRTLPDGIISVLDGGGLAGEGQLMRLKPEETQMLLFGNELDIDVQRNVEALPPRPIAVRWRDGLVVTSVFATDHRTAITNRSRKTQSIWLALKLGPGTDVVSGQRNLVDPHAGYTWVVTDAPPGPSSAPIRVERRQDETREVGSVTTEELRTWAKDRLGDPSALKAAAQRREALDAIESTLASIRQEHTRATAQAEGFRRDLSVAPDSDGLARKVAAAEQELRQIAERIDRAEAERNTALEALTESLRKLAAEG